MTTTKKAITKKKSKPAEKPNPATKPISETKFKFVRHTKPAAKRVTKPKHPNFNKLTADEIYDWAMEQPDPIGATNSLLGYKQEKFVEIILIEPFNYYQAYRNAGYTASSNNVAKSAASRLLRNHKVEARIRILKNVIMDNIFHRAEEVISGLWDIRDRCAQMKPVMEYVDREWVETGEYVFDSKGFIAASKLLGLHYKLFTKKHEIDGLDFKITISKAYEDDKEPDTDSSTD